MEDNLFSFFLLIVVVIVAFARYFKSLKQRKELQTILDNFSSALLSLSSKRKDQSEDNEIVIEPEQFITDRGFDVKVNQIVSTLRDYQFYGKMLIRKQYNSLSFVCTRDYDIPSITDTKRSRTAA